MHDDAPVTRVEFDELVARLDRRDDQAAAFELAVVRVGSDLVSGTSLMLATIKHQGDEVPLMAHQLIGRSSERIEAAQAQVVAVETIQVSRDVETPRWTAVIADLDLSASADSPQEAITGALRLAARAAERHHDMGSVLRPKGAEAGPRSEQVVDLSVEDEGSAVGEGGGDVEQADTAGGVSSGASVVPPSLRMRDIITSYDFETQRWTSYVEQTGFEASARDAAVSVIRCLKVASDAEILPADLTTGTPRSQETGNDDAPATAVNQAPWTLWDFGSAGLLGTDVDEARRTVATKLAPLHDLIESGPLTMADLTYFHMLLDETYTRLNRTDRLVYQRRDPGSP